jgi:hypothetical protein
MQSGSCLCGAVKYEIAGELSPIQLCHCSMCRRSSGTAFASNMPVRAIDLCIVAGEAALKAYESRPGKHRVFCGECGSPIFSRSRGDPSMVRVRAGTLHDPAPTHAAFHFHVASKASWLPITDDLPQYPAARPR